LKILVPVKRVIDYNVKVRVKADGTGVDLANVKMSMNPFDEIAVEEAMRLKEGGKATEVVAVSCGVTACQETLRTAMAIGADRASLSKPMLNCSPGGGQAAGRRGKEGRPATHHPGQAGDRRRLQPDRPDARRACLAGRRRRFASKVVIGDGKATVTREIDGGLETLDISLPAIVTTDLRLNEPRYATLPNIMKAKKKPLDVVKPADLGVDVAPRLATVTVTEPPKRSAGIKVADVAQLVDKLKNEAKVIA
jgi:electron transfer flavoprotein beta subunit